MNSERWSKDALLDAQAEAALAGHDLGEFVPVESSTAGWQAKCRLCGKTTWINDAGLRYSILEDTCPSRV